MKIAFTLTREVLETLNEYCKKYGYNRSEFIRDCIRDRLFEKIDYKAEVKEEN